MTSMTVQPAPSRSRLRSRALVVVAAVVAAAVVWLVAVPVLGVDLAAAVGGEPATVGLVPVLVAAALPALAGWALLAVLEHLLRRGLLVWTVIAVVVLLTSLAPVFLPGDTTTASRIVLGLLHVAVAVVLVPGLRVTSPQRAA